MSSDVVLGLACGAGVSLLLAVLLVADHWYRHGPAGGSNELGYPDRCFQTSDVGNLHSFSHEMFILPLLGAASILAICAGAYSL